PCGKVSRVGSDGWKQVASVVRAASYADALSCGREQRWRWSTCWAGLSAEGAWVMKKVRSAAGRVLMGLGIIVAGVAVWPSPQAQAAEQASAKPDATATASGEVRRVDAAAGKVAIKHDAISALELPAMTL